MLPDTFPTRVRDPLPWSDQETARVIRCRSEACRMPVYWSVTQLGKPCLFDVDEEGTATDVSHFKTCKEPKRFTRKK